MGRLRAPQAAGQQPAGAGGGIPEAGALPGVGGHKQFAPEELAVVLSHYDIGEIQATQVFARGSRKSPKLLIRCDRGVYLLKRRAKGRDDPFKVAFAHAVQLYLSDHHFPLPRLIGTKEDNNSMLQVGAAVYELFEYIPSSGYDNSLEATQAAGKALAAFHLLLRHYKPRFEPACGCFHAAKSVGSAIKQIPATFHRTDACPDPSQRDRMEEGIQFLRAAYHDASRRVQQAGLDKWPMQVIHSDWHPGNMLFTGPKLVAVLDFDAARVQQRVMDIANGLLQFSILGGCDEPAQWPDYLDESRFKRFLRGYRSVDDANVTNREIKIVPWLMIEALIAESVIPIAATGSFARMDGIPFLDMVERKVRWIAKHAGHLIALLAA